MKAATHHDPLSAKAMVSAVKVENVLKPPHKPVINNNLRDSEIWPVVNRPSTAPITKQARVFAINVANGKVVAAALRASSKAIL